MGEERMNPSYSGEVSDVSTLAVLQFKPVGQWRAEECLLVLGRGRSKKKILKTVWGFFTEHSSTFWHSVPWCEEIVGILCTVIALSLQSFPPPSGERKEKILSFSLVDAWCCVYIPRLSRAKLCYGTLVHLLI